MEDGSYYWDDEEPYTYAYEASGYNSDHYYQGSNQYCTDYPFEGSSPQQLAWGCCVSEASMGSSEEEEQSQPDCPCQNVSTPGSEGTPPASESDCTDTESEWETDDGSSSVASSSETSSWETASTEESASSWETATLCSCEAVEGFTACQSCEQTEESQQWDKEPLEYPNDSSASKWMSHPFSEGGGRSGVPMPLLPSVNLRMPLQQRLSPGFRRWKKMNSSGVGRRPEIETKEVTERKQARKPCTIQNVISTPANPITAQKGGPAQSKSTRPRKQRFRWKIRQRRKMTTAVKIGDGVAGPSGKNQRQLRTAS